LQKTRNFNTSNTYSANLFHTSISSFQWRTNWGYFWTRLACWTVRTHEQLPCTSTSIGPDGNRKILAWVQLILWTFSKAWCANFDLPKCACFNFPLCFFSLIVYLFYQCAMSHIYKKLCKHIVTKENKAEKVSYSTSNCVYYEYIARKYNWKKFFR